MTIPPSLAQKMPQGAWNFIRYSNAPTDYVYSAVRQDLETAGVLNASYVGQDGTKNDAVCAAPP